MIEYLNLSGNSPISHYEIGDDFIIIKFREGKFTYYIYSYRGKAGKHNVDLMKILAQKGRGLAAFINKEVKDSYDRHWN